MQQPPETEEELFHRARGLSGRSVWEVAAGQGLKVPKDQRRAKGWVGQLMDGVLGAQGGSRAVHDFPHLEIELKTIPVDENARPLESTYVCTAPAHVLLRYDWSESWVRHKLQRVLWLPIVGRKTVPLAERRVGTALLWSPSQEQDSLLEQDWTELAELILAGELHRLHSGLGEGLQLRPKAANSREVHWVTDIDGQRVAEGPRGFYLRSSFTGAILERAFNTKQNSPLPGAG